MELFCYIFPFIAGGILFALCFNRARERGVLLGQIGGVILFSCLSTLGIRSIMIYSNENDTEYLGGYITKITHYDEWDEWIEKTCTRQVPDGRDENGHTKYRTETYDCSYRDFHPERWKYTNNYGHEEYFWSEKEFLDAMRELGNPPMVFRDMHRDYYRIDGDAQDYFYDGTVEHVRALTDSHSYKNKLINSKSIFKYEEISPEEARKLGLFDYPEIKSYDQEVVLGIDVSYTTEKKFKYINAIYGSPKQFRVYILAFKNKPYSISEKQKAYWQGGNKNEFVVCLGYDAKTRKINWCNAFSWSDKPTLEVATKRFFREHAHVAYLGDYADWLPKHLNLWKRKEFKDFDYIENTLTSIQSMWLVILTIIINMLLCGIIFVMTTEDYRRNRY